MAPYDLRLSEAVTSCQTDSMQRRALCQPKDSDEGRTLPSLLDSLRSQGANTDKGIHQVRRQWRTGLQIFWEKLWLQSCLPVPIRGTEPCFSRPLSVGGQVVSLLYMCWTDDDTSRWLLVIVGLTPARVFSSSPPWFSLDSQRILHFFKVSPRAEDLGDEVGSGRRVVQNSVVLNHFVRFLGVTSLRETGKKQFDGPSTLSHAGGAGVNSGLGRLVLNDWTSTLHGSLLWCSNRFAQTPLRGSIERSWCRTRRAVKSEKLLADRAHLKHPHTLWRVPRTRVDTG